MIERVVDWVNAPSLWIWVEMCYFSQDVMWFKTCTYNFCATFVTPHTSSLIISAQNGKKKSYPPSKGVCGVVRTVSVMALPEKQGGMIDSPSSPSGFDVASKHLNPLQK